MLGNRPNTTNERIRKTTSPETADVFRERSEIRSLLIATRLKRDVAIYANLLLG